MRDRSGKRFRSANIRKFCAAEAVGETVPALIAAGWQTRRTRRWLLRLTSHGNIVDATSIEDSISQGKSDRIPKCFCVSKECIGPSVSKTLQ